MRWQLISAPVGVGADKTCKLWNSENGDLFHTYRGHSTEIVCLSFNPQGSMVATVRAPPPPSPAIVADPSPRPALQCRAQGSMDNTARLWDVETGECMHTLLGHTAEVGSEPMTPSSQWGAPLRPHSLLVARRRS